MSLVYGHADASLQQALLELCFSDQSVDPDFRAPRLAQLDDALQRDAMSGEQLRVLPLLYRLVPIDQISDGSKTKIIGSYKHTLWRNSMMLSRLAEVQAAFAKAGFEPLIGMKGLSALAYLQQGVGARPMADVDALIPRLHERADEVMKILARMGYQVKASGFRSVSVTSPDHLSLDLHWYVHDWALGQELVDAVQASSQTQPLQSHSVLVPCLEHHLAHTLAHGVLTNTLTWDARWVFDVVGVLRQHPIIDAEKFAEFANHVMAPALLREGLSALARDLPDAVQVDRDQLLRLRSAVRTNSKWVSWLYRQRPMPNLELRERPPMPLMERIKAMVRPSIWTAIWLRRHQGLSFIGYWRWVGQFPPDNGWQTAWRFLRKAFLRIPVMLYHGR